MEEDLRFLGAFSVMAVGLTGLSMLLPRPYRWSGYPPIEVLSVDADGDGIIGPLDEVAMRDALGFCEGELGYRRMFDINFDGCVSDQPWSHTTLTTDESFFYSLMGLELSVIREKIKTGMAEYLEWPDGWGAWMVALKNEGENHHYPIHDFTGALTVPVEGWIHEIWHPYTLDDYHYVCHHFAMDTAIAAYKALGYGCLSYAMSVPHAYNIYWLGGDWHDLNNWWILEPQSGAIFGNAADQPARAYQTWVIIFFDRRSMYGESEHVLLVDYEKKTVDYLDGYFTWGGFSETLEEPAPAVFNRSLGVPG